MFVDVTFVDIFVAVSLLSFIMGLSYRCRLTLITHVFPFQLTSSFAYICLSLAVLDSEITIMFGIYFMNNVLMANILLDYFVSLVPLLKHTAVSGYVDLYFSISQQTISFVDIMFYSFECHYSVLGFY